MLSTRVDERAWYRLLIHHHYLSCLPISTILRTQPLARSRRQTSGGPSAIVIAFFLSAGVKRPERLPSHGPTSNLCGTERLVDLIEETSRRLAIRRTRHTHGRVGQFSLLTGVVTSVPRPPRRLDVELPDRRYLVACRLPSDWKVAEKATITAVMRWATPLLPGRHPQLHVTLVGIDRLVGQLIGIIRGSLRKAKRLAIGLVSARPDVGCDGLGQRLLLELHVRLQVTWLWSRPICGPATAR